MTTANLCSAPESLTSPLSPFSPDRRSGILPASRETMCQETYQIGRGVIRPGETPPTSNSDRRAVEFGHREPVEILAGVVVALVSQQTDRRGLTEQQSGIAIRPPMNPREVAC